MRRRIYIPLILLVSLLAASRLFAQVPTPGQGVTTWQANQAFVDYVNQQISTINTQIAALNSQIVGGLIGFPLTGNVSGGNFKIQNLGPGTVAGDPLIFGQAGGSISDLTATDHWGNKCINVAQLPLGSIGDTRCVRDWNSVPGYCVSAGSAPNSIGYAQFDGNGWICGNLIDQSPVLNALSFPGTDIGAQINAAFNSFLPVTTGQCGEVYVPAGSYNFSTTIAPPIVGHSNGKFATQCRLTGAGRGSTVLHYTGSGAAFSQVITAAAEQNDLGAVIYKLTIDGTSAGAGAIGVDFGGSSLFGFQDVAVTNFNATANANNSSGVEVENAIGMSTDRPWSRGLYLSNNTNGIRFLVDSGGMTAYSKVNFDDVQFSSTSAQTNFSLEQGAIVDGYIKAQGTQVGIAAENDVFCLTGSSQLLTNLDLTATCKDAQNGCIRFNVGTGSTVNIQALSKLLNYPATTDVNTGTLTVAVPLATVTSANVNNTIVTKSNFQTGAPLATVSNSVSETTLYSYSLAGNTLGATGVLHCHAAGEYLNNSGGNAQYTLKVYYGASALLTGLTNNIAASATSSHWSIDWTIATTGATNTEYLEGFFPFTAASVAGTLTGQQTFEQGYNTAAVDSTAAQTVKLSGTMASNTATQTLSSSEGYCELE